MNNAPLNQEHDVDDPMVLTLDDEEPNTTTRTTIRTTPSTSRPSGTETGSPIPAEDALVSTQRPTPPESPPQKVVPVRADTERVPTPVCPVHQPEAAPPPRSQHGVPVLQIDKSARTPAVVQLKPTSPASATPSVKRARVEDESKIAAKPQKDGGETPSRSYVWSTPPTDRTRASDESVVGMAAGSRGRARIGNTVSDKSPKTRGTAKTTAKSRRSARIGHGTDCASGRALGRKSETVRLPSGSLGGPNKDGKICVMWDETKRMMVQEYCEYVASIRKFHLRKENMAPPNKV
ncbi:hypothetical protein B0T24DRAFT_598135 [Lasiosphaeria ovina]|uniref:Uncharacterized protein n=1 Tax=Lasiosphaeria ovina TaxID=92902 RepID=A0AAE0JUY7_9PEZI|nr:hypothetical protein B0T24DRAFT_598135 [Lasiosphaeria ovina]